jgi:hypothetical protein
MSRLICRECGEVLTDDERHYYDGRCEKCVCEWSDRISAWRRGGDDPELDDRFKGDEPKLN